jgi:hypothetical protein
VIFVWFIGQVPCYYVTDRMLINYSDNTMEKLIIWHCDIEAQVQVCVEFTVWCNTGTDTKNFAPWTVVSNHTTFAKDNVSYRRLCQPSVFLLVTVTMTTSFLWCMFTDEVQFTGVDITATQKSFAGWVTGKSTQGSRIFSALVFS